MYLCSAIIKNKVMEQIVNTVEELINALSKYPKDKKVHTNQICENVKGEILLMHKTTDEEIEYMRRREKEREEEAERGRDMPTFASRW
jgi:hypothetical protein